VARQEGCAAGPGNRRRSAVVLRKGGTREECHLLKDACHNTLSSKSCRQRSLYSSSNRGPEQPPRSTVDRICATAPISDRTTSSRVRLPSSWLL